MVKNRISRSRIYIKSALMAYDRKIFEKLKYFSKKHLTKYKISVIISYANGASPSGKATDPDSVIT